jgi:Cu/Zn superoxide dismutase
MRQRAHQLGPMGRKYGWLGLALVVIGALAVDAKVLFGSGSSGPSEADSGQAFAVAAAAVQTNRVTGSGTATVELRGDTATVTLRTSGLLAGSPHLMHIHAKGLGSCPPASAARLHNGHLAISTADGLRYYGPPLSSLTEWGSTSGNLPTNVNMNLYPASGNIRYSRTLTITPELATLIRRGDAVIVVHGIDYDHTHVYDFRALGASDLDKTLPGEATAPALCGPLVPFPRTTATVGQNEHSSPIPTFVASLAADAATGNREWLSRLFLFCHLGEAVAGAQQG